MYFSNKLILANVKVMHSQSKSNLPKWMKSQNTSNNAPPQSTRTASLGQKDLTSFACTHTLNSQNKSNTSTIK